MSISLDKIVSIEFISKVKAVDYAIHPKVIWDICYKGLDPLILLNRVQYLLNNPLFRSRSRRRIIRQIDTLANIILNLNPERQQDYRGPISIIQKSYKYQMDASARVKALDNLCNKLNTYENKWNAAILVSFIKNFMDDIALRRIELQNQSGQKLNIQNPDIYILRATLVKNWEDSEFPEIFANVRFKDSTIVRYRVDGRTNFNPDFIKKRPNIVHLTPENGDPLVLRESRFLPYDGVVSGVTRTTHNLGVLYKWSNGRVEGLSIGRKLKNRLREDFYHKLLGGIKLDYQQLKSSSSNVVLLPEPHLLLALEKLYSTYEMGRITPPFRIITSDNNTMWILRHFIPSIQDMGVSEDQLGNYLGVLHGVGLMDSCDTQLAHYCLLGTRIINFDPDLWTFTRNIRYTELTDRMEFYSEICDLQTARNINFSAVTRIRMEEIKSLKSCGVTPQLFYACIPEIFNSAISNTDTIGILEPVSESVPTPIRQTYQS